MTPDEVRRREEQRRHRGMRRELARQARKEPTPAEKALWELVRDHRCGGLSIRRQVWFGPFRVDFYCPAHKLVIEVDGGIHQEAEVARRDRDRQQILEQDPGLRFVRLTNDDVLTRPAKARAAILAAAGMAESPTPGASADPSPQVERSKNWTREAVRLRAKPPRPSF